MPAASPPILISEDARFRRRLTQATVRKFLNIISVRQSDAKTTKYCGLMIYGRSELKACPFSDDRSPLQCIHIGDDYHAAEFAIAVQDRVLLPNDVFGKRDRLPILGQLEHQLHQVLIPDAADHGLRRAN